MRIMCTYWTIHICSASAQVIEVLAWGKLERHKPRTVIAGGVQLKEYENVEVVCLLGADNVWQAQQAFRRFMWEKLRWEGEYKDRGHGDTHLCRPIVNRIYWNFSFIDYLFQGSHSFDPDCMRVS